MTTAEMIASSKIMKRENFVSIRELQKSPTKILSSDWDLKFIMNNGKPMWVYLNYETWEDFLEEMELLANDEYINMIEKSRNSKDIPAELVWKNLWI